MAEKRLAKSVAQEGGAKTRCSEERQSGPGDLFLGKDLMSNAISLEVKTGAELVKLECKLESNFRIS